MASAALTVAYFAVGTLLFFFWVYGIWSFARDVRYRFVPAAREYRRERRREKEAEQREREREERERQLY